MSESFGTFWADGPSGGTPLAAGTLNAREAAYKTLRDEMVDLNNDVDTKIAAIPTTSDSVTAGLVTNPSTTRTALDGRYAQATAVAGLASADYVDDTVNALADDVVQAEDLLATIYREVSIPIGANTVIPIIAAPYPMRLTSLSLTSFQSTTNIPASDSTWWLTRVRYTRQSTSETAVNIATKTTRASAGTEPAGEAITRLKPWTMAQVDISSVSLEAGDVVSWIFSPQGAVAAIPGPLVITVGYQPL